MALGPTISSILRGSDAVQPSQEEVRDRVTQIKQILTKQEETFNSINNELATLKTNPPSPQTLRSQFSLYLLQNPDLQSKLLERLASQRAELAANSFLASGSSEPETEPEKTTDDKEDAATGGVEVQQQEEAEVAEMMSEVEEISREFPDEEHKTDSEDQHNGQHGEADRLSTSSIKEVETVESTELDPEQEPTGNSPATKSLQPSPPPSVSPSRVKTETEVEEDKPKQSPSLLPSPSDRRSNSVANDEEIESAPISANSSVIILDGETNNSEVDVQSSVSAKKDSSLPATGRSVRNIKKADSSEKDSDSLGVLSTTGEPVPSQESIVPATPSPIKTRLSTLTEAAGVEKNKEEKVLEQENQEDSAEKTTEEDKDEAEKKLTTPSRTTVTTSIDGSKPKRASTRSSLVSSSSILPDPPSTERPGPRPSAVFKKRLASPSASSEFSSELGDGEEDEERDRSDLERRRIKRGKPDVPSSDRKSRHTEEEDGGDGNEDEREKGKGKEKESSRSKARSKREPISSPIRAPLTRLRSDLSLSKSSSKVSRPPSDPASNTTDDSTVLTSSTLDRESLKGSSTITRQTALNLGANSQQVDELSRPRRAVKDRKAKADVARTKRVRELKGEGKRGSESEPDETDDDDGGDDQEKEGEGDGMEGFQEEQTADEEEGEPRERRSKRGKVIVKEEKTEAEDDLKKSLGQGDIGEREEVKEETEGLIDEDEAEAEKDVKDDAINGDENDDEDDEDDLDEDDDDDLDDDDDNEEEDEGEEGTLALKRSKRKSISSTGSAANTTGGAGSNKKLTKAEQAELTAEQVMEAHEQKKAERRVRDRARRERERAAKVTKQAEQAATRERKRKRDLPAAQADSTSNDGEPIVKRRRGDISATPEDSVPPSSAQQPPTRQSSQTPTLTSTSVPTAMSNPRSFKKTIDLLYQQIAQHRSSSIFQSPIRSVDVPDYHEIVYRPMDLKTIKNRVRDGIIMSLDEFERDVFLMFANATLFNEPGSDVYEQAQAMIADSEDQIRQFRLLQQRLAQQDN